MSARWAHWSVTQVCHFSAFGSIRLLTFRSFFGLTSLRRTRTSREEVDEETGELVEVKDGKSFKMDFKREEDIRISKEMPEKMPEETQEEMPEKMPEEIPEEMPEETPEEMPEDMPEELLSRSVFVRKMKEGFRSAEDLTFLRETMAEKMISMVRGALPKRVLANSKLVAPLRLLVPANAASWMWKRQMSRDDSRIELLLI
jgi:hypothetical protein